MFSSRWHHSYRPMCMHNRSQFHEKRVYFESMFANTNVRNFFQKRVLFDDDVLAISKNCIFLWFARMWNPRNLTIRCLIYSRITQVLDIVEWFCGLFCPKYSKTLPSISSRSRGLFTWSDLNEVWLGLVDHVFIYNFFY